MLKSLRYDPDRHIDREEWLAVDEQERIEAVYQYHRRMKIRLPNARVHAIIHAIVENQVALGEKFAAESVLLRLIGEGLKRHEAIHALGYVLAQHMFSTLKGGAAETMTLPPISGILSAYRRIPGGSKRRSSPGITEYKTDAGRQMRVRRKSHGA